MFFTDKKFLEKEFFKSSFVQKLYYLKLLCIQYKYDCCHDKGTEEFIEYSNKIRPSLDMKSIEYEFTQLNDYTWFCNLIFFTGFLLHLNAKL